MTVSGVIADLQGSGDAGATGPGGVSISGTGVVTLAAKNTFDGGVTIEPDATLDLAHTGAAGGNVILFDGIGKETLEFDAANAPAEPLEGLGTGDVIRVVDKTVTADHYTVSSTNARIGSLQLDFSGGGTATLQVFGIHTQADFTPVNGVVEATTPVQDVGSQTDLNNYIKLLDTLGAPGDYTVQFTKTITEGDAGQPAGIYALQLAPGVNVTIDGGGFALDGNGTSGGLAVLGGQVTIEDLTIEDTVAQGGNATGSGGGGAGLGGGLFVGPTASVTLRDVNFSTDAAQGGAGGLGGGGGAGGNSSLIVPDLGGDGADGDVGHPGSFGAPGLGVTVNEGPGGPGSSGGAAGTGTAGGPGGYGGKGGDGGAGGDGGLGGPGGSSVPRRGGFGGGGLRLGPSGGPFGFAVASGGGQGGDGAAGGTGGDGGKGAIGGIGAAGGDGGDGGGGGDGGNGGVGYSGVAHGGNAGDGADGGRGGDGASGGYGGGGGAGGGGGDGGKGGDGGLGATKSSGPGVGETWPSCTGSETTNCNGACSAKTSSSELTGKPQWRSVSALPSMVL